MFRTVFVFFSALCFVSVASAGNLSNWDKKLNSAFQPSLVAGFELAPGMPLFNGSKSEYQVPASQRKEPNWGVALTASLKGYEQFGAQADYHPSYSEKADFRDESQEVDAFGLVGVDLRGFRIGARISF